MIINYYKIFFMGNDTDKLPIRPNLIQKRKISKKYT